MARSQIATQARLTEPAGTAWGDAANSKSADAPAEIDDPASSATMSLGRVARFTP